MAKLDGRVALVAGGQRGLGAAILREFAAEGATCIVNYPGPADRCVYRKPKPAHNGDEVRQGSV
jgi:NAD(P)-dependent dehydrogenase (short-subunit alcohol dehydrogenase family)